MCYRKVICLQNFGNFESYKPGTLKYLIHTHVGDGPRVLTNPSDHLLNGEGLPKNLGS